MLAYPPLLEKGEFRSTNVASSADALAFLSAKHELRIQWLKRADPAAIRDRHVDLILSAPADFLDQLEQGENVAGRQPALEVHGWLEQATRDVTVEKTVMIYTLLVYSLVALLLMLASMALDYAKIAMVVEKRTSSILAFFRGLRFVFSNPGKTIGLYLMLILVGFVLLIFYAIVAPGPGQSRRITVILAFLVGQLFLLSRLILKLWFLASQTVFFQSRQDVTRPAAPITPLGGA